MAGAETVTLPRGLSQLEVKRIREQVDKVQAVMDQATAKWGSGRLRLLVGEDLRARFDRQRLAYNRAVWRGELAEVERHAAAMIRGYLALDQAAMAGGAEKLGLPQVWELILPDGSIGALVQSEAEAEVVLDSAAYQMVWTTHEVSEVLREFPTLVMKRFGVTPSDPIPLRKPINWAKGDDIPDLSPKATPRQRAVLRWSRLERMLPVLEETSSYYRAREVCGQISDEFGVAADREGVLLYRLVRACGKLLNAADGDFQRSEQETGS
jgi:hypothetical protein